MRPYPNEFVWFPERGYGYFPVSFADMPYDKAYFERYQKQDRSEIGDKLNAARVALVAKYMQPGKVLCDVGIGGGRFIEDAAEVLGTKSLRGYDVNPEAERWIHSRAAWHDIYSWHMDAATFWDSLEHIHFPEVILANIKEYLFVSLPIFTGPEHVLRSKHFRKDEHCHYWTDDGFKRYMTDAGFELVESNTMEQDAGREDIGTYVFRRKHDSN